VAERISDELDPFMWSNYQQLGVERAAQLGVSPAEGFEAVAVQFESMGEPLVAAALRQRAGELDDVAVPQVPSVVVGEDSVTPAAGSATDAPASEADAPAKAAKGAKPQIAD